MNKARAKGTGWESAIVDELIGEGFIHAHRNPLSSPEGDVGGVGVVIEAKNHASMDIGTWVLQAEKSSERTGKRFFVFHKRRGKNVKKGYATTTIDHAIQFMKAYEICVSRGDLI